jgi:hypothetical protein
MESTIKTSYSIRLMDGSDSVNDFETYDNAVNYAKDKYPNSSYKIVKVTEETLVTVLLRK